ncbi:energy transducer TonB [Thalassotalea piscium]
MNTEETGINNALMISLIISFILHFSLLQMNLNSVVSEEKISLPSLEQEIQIPIEFIPSNQPITIREYSASQIEAVTKLVETASDNTIKPATKIRKTGTYSLNRTKAALNRYLLDIREVIEKNKFSLTPEIYTHIVGNVTISFSISAEGTFSKIRITESSSDPDLDKSALIAVESASGKTKRPKITGTTTIKASAVIKYQYGM